MEGKVALITGGRRGLGHGFALAFAEAGADVAFCDIAESSKFYFKTPGVKSSSSKEVSSLEAAAEEVRKFGHRVLAIEADVTNKNNVEDMVKKVTTEFGKIDILINNAGFLQSSFVPLIDIDDEVWKTVMGVNLEGGFLVSRAVAHTMVPRKQGCIINIASVGGLRPTPKSGVYSISKAGVIMLTKVLARDLGPHNIRVNAIAPGTMHTDQGQRFINSNPEYAKAAETGLPLGRFGSPDDIVGTALFLATDAARWLTGQLICVDGGGSA
jgi:NAD(P)-dependent dehydrogenase (short-subunit alcohol dehydrogenase family)